MAYINKIELLLNKNELMPPTPHTGTAVNTRIETLEVPAGFIKQGDLVFIQTGIHRIDGTAASIASRVYWSDHPTNLNNLLATSSLSTAQFSSGLFRRFPVLSNTTVLNGIPNSTNAAVDTRAVSTALQTIEIADITQISYIHFALQNTSGADSSQMSFAQIQLLRKLP